MRHRWPLAGLGFVILILAGPVPADPPGLGVVSFSVQAQREVEAQRMQVRMFAETSGARAEDVHQALALRVEAALKILRSAGLKGTTSGYNSRPLRDPGQATIRGWLGRYDLSWETDDAKRGHEVLSKILAHMDVAGLGFVALILAGPVPADPPGLGVVSFSVQAQREVEAQRMQVRMFAETSGARAEDVHQALALRVEAALKILRAAGLKGTTSGYNSRPLRDPGQATIRGWLGRYDLSWETDDAKRGHEVLSKILAHMDVAGIGFAVSDQLRAEVTEALIAEALETFEQRARGIADALDRRGFSLGEVTISEQGGPPVVPMRATMAMAEAAPIEPGTTRLGVTVTGSIVLDPPTQ